jgi:hypothetical protein
VLTFFAITTIVNLALGYGLAIFLMRSQLDQSDTGLPMQTANIFTETTSPAPPVPMEVKSVPSSTPPAAPSKSKTPIAELPELVSPMLSAQPQPESSKSSIQKPGSEPESITEQSPAVEPEPASIASNDSNTQPPSEEDLLAGIAAFRAQLSAETPPIESNPSNEVDAGCPTADVPG